MSLVPIPPPSQEHEPELRRVTVLFADIQGSTALIQDLDPEDAAGLIDPALHAMIDAAERFDGVVSHRGDGIMAIFGAPSVSEDHGVRACLAALTMRDALTGGGARAGVVTPGTRARDVRLRIGIHVGDVVFRAVRIGGAWTQDAVGIAVHVAARLEQSAEAGTICLSRAALDAASGFIRAIPLGPIAVKGVDMPIERFELVEAERAANRWAVRAARGLSAFVDRIEERRALEEALEEDGLRAVLIHGGAGLGKSRLLHEFLATSAAQSCHAVTLVGDHHRRFVPFHPLAAWLRGWLDIRLTDDPARARQKLAERLAGLDGLDVEILARILDLAAPVRDALLPGSLAPVDFGTPVAALLRAMAGGRRIILVCEDADSFDPATQDVVDSVLDRLTGDDVLLVSASRTPVRFATLPTARIRSLALSPLSDDDTAELLAEIDPRFTGQKALAGAIIRKAGGNPLFVEEVAPMAATQTQHAAFDAPPPDIPDRVEALIADRLARLPRALRNLVELAAVIGMDVPTTLLAALSGSDPAELHAALADLHAEQILYESGRYPEAVFSFKHALTRDVAYRKMLAARRRAHHAHIVSLLEAGGDAARARNIDDLCVHAVHARLWEPAVRYLQHAARQATARSAFRSALAALTRARDIAGAHLADSEATARNRLDLLSNLLVLVQTSGLYPDALPVMDEAEQLAIRLDDRAALARIRAGRVHVLSILGRLEEAIALGSQLRSSARSAGDHAQAARTGFYIGQIQFNAGKLREADRTLTRNLEEMNASNDRPDAANADFVALHGTRTTLLPQALGTRAMARAFLAEFASAETDAASAAAEAVAARPYERIFAAAARGFVAVQSRRPEAAVRHFRHALAQSDEAEISQLRPPALAGLGHALLMAGDLDGASETLAAAHRLARAEQRWMFGLFAATGLALADIALGEPDLALGFADEAVGIAERFGYAGFRVHALRARGVALAITAGREADGHACIFAAIEAARGLGMLAEIAHGHAALASVRAPDDEVHLARALRRYAALGMSGWGTRVRAEIEANRLPYL